MHWLVCFPTKNPAHRYVCHVFSRRLTMVSSIVLTFFRLFQRWQEDYGLPPKPNDDLRLSIKSGGFENIRMTHRASECMGMRCHSLFSGGALLVRVFRIRSQTAGFSRSTLLPITISAFFDTFNMFTRYLRKPLSWQYILSANVGSILRRHAKKSLVWSSLDQLCEINCIVPNANMDNVIVEAFTRLKGLDSWRRERVLEIGPRYFERSFQV